MTDFLQYVAFVVAVPLLFVVLLVAVAPTRGYRGVRPRDTPKVPPAGVRAVHRSEAERREAYTMRSQVLNHRQLGGEVLWRPTDAREAPVVKLDYVVQAPTPFPWPREPKEN